MQNAELIHFVFLTAAIALEVAANIFIKYSDGFRRRAPGVAGILSILASFTALSYATQGIDLSVAYALWGGTGIVLTASAGLMLFKQRLTHLGWSGIAAVVTGLLVLKFFH